MGTLENDHNVYIIGAGFSADRGLPVLANFMLAMRDAHPWLMTQGREVEANSIQKVLEYRLQAASAGYRVRIELENIEELFSLASASLNPLTPDIRRAIAATLDYCQNANRAERTRIVLPKDTIPTKGNVVLQPVKAGDGQVVLTMPTYEQYVGALLGWFQSGEVVGKNTFISFNYDTLVEESLSGLGIDFTYGFNPSTVNVDSNASLLRLRDNASVSVLKLHGSNNWARADEKTGELTVFGSYADVRANNLVPDLVPPTWRKVFGQQLNDIWSGALTAIESATRVIMIGFSMPETDLHFKYLLAAGLQRNLSLRQIVAVNPDGSTVDKRLSAMLIESPIGYKRWLVTGGTFRHFIEPRYGDATSIVWYGRLISRGFNSFQYGH
jgi:hypothetical protein